ncbi:putative membrane protein [Brevundimonas alba]|uniref:Putative membrane protein n=1 Tax=Brevundimonas alba TaxID=74314 RepID=A0A7X6BMY2_9CAUL|nr:DUF2306 domain-containing protein [Brevundimonas alba]NJC39891.1 putative membrane protein [Brevundimonas alba]
MDTLFLPTLALHITAGLLAVLVGIVPIITRKGSRLHRLAGRVFVVLMATLLACAWLMTAIHFNAYFLALSATASMTLFSGVRVLRRKRPDLRREDRARPLDWVFTLSVVGVGVWTLVLVVTGRTGATAPVAASLAYAALLYGGWDLWRFARPTDWPFSPELWTYEHLAKMMGAYGAVLAAFSGNFMTFLPTPWSQLWPSLLLQPLVIGWIALMIVRKRSRRLVPA